MVDLTIPSYLIAAVVLYYGALFAMSTLMTRSSGAHRLRTDLLPMAADLSMHPLVVIVIPARNEESVIGATLENLSRLTYRGQFRLLVVDDGSTDDTALIAGAYAYRDGRIRLLSRRAPNAGQGKSEVLNAAYTAVTQSCVNGDPWLTGSGVEDVVIGIVDADGRLENDALEAVAPYFADPSVASVQIGVRIGNADRSGLARMQDMEFVGFSSMVQVARDRLGSSGLGGNGQFTRIRALAHAGPTPWSPGALTEDLDLGLKLVSAGWRTRYCHETFVTQQGLERWRPLLRQRTRWIQGHYQCWKYISPLMRSRTVRLATRLDLIAYLLLVTTVLLVSATVLLGLLGSLGVVTIQNDFLMFVPAGFPRRLVSMAFSICPAVLFMYVYQRHSGRPFRWFEIPAYALVFTIYTYVWLITTARALTRLATGNGTWDKTPRVIPAATPELEPGLGSRQVRTS